MATTIAADTTSTVPPPPAATDPTLPVLSIAEKSGLADETIAQAVVDDKGYDVCALIDGDPGITALLGQDVDHAIPRTLLELTQAYGHRAGSDNAEGAVSCTAYGASDTSTSAPTVTVRVWTDESLQFSLADPTATAAQRAMYLRFTQWGNGSGSDALSFDLLGVGDGGWSGYEPYNASAFAWQGPILASLSVNNTSPNAFCSGEHRPPFTCEQNAVAPTVGAFTALFASMVTTMLSGNGSAAAFPEPASAAGSALVETPSGAKDLCTLVGDGLAATNPAQIYDPPTSSDNWVQSLGDATVEGGKECLFTPRDRDAAAQVQVVAFGSDHPESAQLFADDESRITPEPLAGLGDLAYAYFASVFVLQGGVYVSFFWFAPGAGSDDAAAQSQVVALATAVVAQL